MAGVSRIIGANKVTGRREIQVLLRVNPFCNHPAFVDTCIYCADAQRVYRKLLGIQNQTRLDKTKVDVVDAANNKED